MPLPDVMDDGVRRALLANAEMRDEYLRARLLELTAESGAVAIKAIELLLDMEFTIDDSEEFAEKTIGELVELRERADDYIRKAGAGAGANGSQAHD